MCLRYRHKKRTNFSFKSDVVNTWNVTNINNKSMTCFSILIWFVFIFHCNSFAMHGVIKVAVGYGWDDRAILVWVQLGTIDIFSFCTVCRLALRCPPAQCADWLWGAPISFILATDGPFGDLGVKLNCRPHHVLGYEWVQPGAHKSRARAARATKFFIMAPNICGPSVWNLIHVTLLTPRIIRWQLDFSKICVPLSELYLLPFICLHSVHRDNCYPVAQ